MGKAATAGVRRPRRVTDSSPRAVAAGAYRRHITVGGRWSPLLPHFRDEPSTSLRQVLVSPDRAPGPESFAAGRGDAYVRGLLQDAGFLIQVVAVDGRILFANESWKRTLGYDDADLARGLVLHDLFAPTSREEGAALFARTLAGGPLQGIEMTLCTKEGRELVLEGESDCSSEDGGPPVVRAILRDVTVERARSLYAQQVEARYAAIVESLAEGVATISRQGVVTSLNPSGERILGLAARHVIGRRLLDLDWSTVREDGTPLPRGEHPVFHALRTGAGVRDAVVGLERPQHADRVWISVSVRPVAYEGHSSASVAIASFRDVTEQHATAAALRESQQRFERMAAATPDIVYLIDIISVRNVYANDALSRILGYTPAEAQAMGEGLFTMLVHPDDIPRVMENLGRITQAADGAVLPLEYRMRHRDGGWRWLYSRDTVFSRMPDGRVHLLLGVATDVTAMKETERELRVAKERAEEANRVKGDFLASMSHELRTPLNSVIGFANVLLRNTGDRFTEREVEFLQRIQGNGRHLLGLINDVLDLAKVESGRLEVTRQPVALDALVRDVAASFEPQLIGRAIALRTELPTPLAQVVSDEVKLRQILVNLVGNAVKFTMRGNIVLRVVADAEGMPQYIEVADTGIGIPRERQVAVFQAFVQGESGTARTYGGTGLGLTITRSLVELLGLRMTLASQPGVGTSFRLQLAGDAPDVSPPEASETIHAVAGADAAKGSAGMSSDAHSSAPGAPAEADRPDVLVVDDDPDARALLAHLIGEAGFHYVVEAASGRDALEKARRLRPRLVTLDLVMPDIDGWGVIDAFAADPELRDIPIIVVSVTPDETRRAAPMALVAKPITRDDIIPLLAQVLGAR